MGERTQRNTRWRAQLTPARHLWHTREPGTEEPCRTPSSRAFYSSRAWVYKWSCNHWSPNLNEKHAADSSIEDIIVPIRNRGLPVIKWYFGNFCSPFSQHLHSVKHFIGFPGVQVVRNPSANAGYVWDVGFIPPGLTPEGGHSNPLQYSCLEDPMGRGAWQATLHNVAKSQT